MHDEPSPPALPTLLVVDDQPINVRVLHETFAADHRVLMATTGAQALKLCRSHQPDLVLLDVVMPGMDGYEVCRALKADAATRDIPVIFVTARDDPRQEAQGLELGAVDFIAKPVNAAVVRARVRTHLELARSRALLAATLQAAAEGILVTDLQGGISRMNRAFVRMWSVPDELLDADADDIRAFMQAQEIEHGAAPVADGDDDARALELQGDRHFERRAAPFRINAGHGGEVVCFRDVSEGRRATRELRRLNETLESRIDERTAELQAALQRADAANRAKSDFLSNMSHEIRTPIHGVIGLAHLALVASTDARQREQLHKIRVTGQHLLGIVNDILDFSKIEARKLEIEESDLRLAEVFGGVRAQCADAALAKGLELVFDIDPGLDAPRRGDALRIGQVLLNFIGNAIKFSPRGAVSVRAAPLAGADAPLVRFEIEDHGIGMSAAQIAGLFEPFVQADTSTTREFGGTGLGLAISKQLVALMGGEVGVRSEPGRGSTFWFTARLPAGTAVPGADAAVPDAAEAAGLATHWAAIRGARVLLADDQPLNREVTSGMLELAGVVVCTANDGREAVECLTRERFDCVLMDVHMPVLDGLQATRLIRANPAIAHTPVLAMTAAVRPQDRAACLEAGMDDFLVKPLLPEHLYAAVRKWLDASRSGAAAAGRPCAAAAPGVAPLQGPPAGDPEVVDLQVLAKFVAGDAHKLRRYAGLFVAAMPESLAELQGALARGDLPALAALGHRLKASAQMVGALGFARLCELLECLDAAGGLAQARGIIERMPALLARVSVAIADALGAAPVASAASLTAEAAC